MLAGEHDRLGEVYADVSVLKAVCYVGNAVLKTLTQIEAAVVRGDPRSGQVVLMPIEAAVAAELRCLECVKGRLLGALDNSVSRYSRED
jgi:hypothetical protein